MRINKEDGMEMPNIPPADEARSATPNIGFEAAIQSVLREIEKARKQGRLDCCFHPRIYHYTDANNETHLISCYDAVKTAFQSKGYVFRPTGYIGGVWQQTEHICW